MLCTFNHSMAPQHYVYSRYVACLGSQAPPPRIRITSSKFSDDLSLDRDKIHICACTCIQKYPKSKIIQSKLKKKKNLFDPAFVNYSISKPFIRSLSARTYSRTHLDMIQIIEQTLLNLVPEPGQGINHDPRHPGQSVLVPGSVQHNINILWAEFRSGKRGQFLLNQEEHVTRMWGFNQDTQGLDREICVLSRIYLCNPSLTHCQTGEDKWCYMQGNIYHITQEASVLFRFA